MKRKKVNHISPQKQSCISEVNLYAKRNPLTAAGKGVIKRVIQRCRMEFVNPSLRGADYKLEVLGRC